MDAAVNAARVLVLMETEVLHGLYIQESVCRDGWEI